MTLTTGILMAGKISVDIRAIVTTPRRTIKIAITVKVYGRLSANRTIHMAEVTPWFKKGHLFGFECDSPFRGEKSQTRRVIGERDPEQNHQPYHAAQWGDEKQSARTAQMHEKKGDRDR